MKVIYVISEGQTEAKFVNRVLKPYLMSKNIFAVIPITPETSPGHNGGDMTFYRYKKKALDLLKNKKNAIVTSMIDFYKLRRDFPSYRDSKKIDDKYRQVEFLEAEISKEIDNERFIPYIQLHEFEGILFSDLKGFNAINIEQKELVKIKDIVDENPNPELINDGEHTAPSKRLLRIIRKYDKVLYGTMIAESIGIETIIKKCLHFREWINKLINISLAPMQ